MYAGLQYDIHKKVRYEPRLKSLSELVRQSCTHPHKAFFPHDIPCVYLLRPVAAAFNAITNINTIQLDICTFIVSYIYPYMPADISIKMPFCYGSRHSNHFQTCKSMSSPCTPYYNSIHKYICNQLLRRGDLSFIIRRLNDTIKVQKAIFSRLCLILIQSYTRYFWYVLTYILHCRRQKHPEA